MRGIREHHLQTVLVSKGRLPSRDVVAEPLIDIVGTVALDLKRPLAELRAAPMRDIEVMHTPVGGPPLAIVIMQIPVGIRDPSLIERAEARGTEPHSPVETVRYRLRLKRPLVLGLKTLPGGHRHLNLGDLADVAVQRQLASLPEVTERTLPHARLEHALVFAQRRTDGEPVVHAHAGRLLAVHVLTGVGGSGGDQRVPVILRSNHHCVDVFACQQLAEIVVHGAAGVTVLLIHRFLSTFAPVALHVADRNHAAVASSQEVAHVTGAHAAHADAPERDPLVGAEGCRRNDRRRSEYRRTPSRSLKKRPSVKLLHDSLPFLCLLCHQLVEPRTARRESIKPEV